MGEVIYLNRPEEGDEIVDDDFPLGRFFHPTEDGYGVMFIVNEPVRIWLTPEQMEELGVVMIQTASMVSDEED